MSASSPLADSTPQTPTTTAEPTSAAQHHISLVDEERETQQDDTEDNDNREAGAGSQQPGSPIIPQRLRRNPSQLQQSFKRQWTKRKYASYSRDRYDIPASASSPAPEDDPTQQPQVGDPASASQTNYLERSRLKARSLLLQRSKRAYTQHNPQDTALDILYENQRGLFFFGIPKYSSSSLLPADPAPWQTANFRSSPVDIRNAQLPNPGGWEWVWKGWYVDMSRDVDEEGWEYNFNFPLSAKGGIGGGGGWHGNHPWFHSFVRRRRWVRLRRKKKDVHLTKEKAHEFTAEYFTIHPPPRLSSGDAEMDRLREKLEEDEQMNDEDLADIGSLIHVLRRAKVDREKLSAVRQFLSVAPGDELWYLADRMQEIMNLFIYQSSRRQLLSELLRQSSDARTHRESLIGHQHDDEAGKREHAIATRKAENLMLAVQAADEQVKRLEFWSDIKGMAQHGEILREGNGKEGSWDMGRWQGLSPTSTGFGSGEGGDTKDAFRNKQRASEGAPELHVHAEHSAQRQGEKKGDVEDDEDDDAAEAKSAVTAPSKKSSASRVLAVKHPPSSGTKEGSTETEGYYTPAESASEIPNTVSKANRSKDKGKSRMSAILDGVDELYEGSGSALDLAEIEDEAAGEDYTVVSRPQLPSRPTPTSAPPSKQGPSVQFVDPDPVAEPDDDLVSGGRGGGGDGS